MPFDECARDNANSKLPRQVAVSLKVCLILRCLCYVGRIIGKIAIQMVPGGSRQECVKNCDKRTVPDRSLWKHDQLRLLAGRLADELTGFVEVVSHFKRLKQCQLRWFCMYM
jgi:hypothetical protein